ncbi:DNA-directed RNA polymerase sigma-70 factor [Echinicola pacifica]|uniref:DNA-directed RNA polymerase sigma-70 factor n=1 Tax=Echinicola pacifica TaxID=346377 RepID=A0A918UIZ5_9BACT|nr:sigma-70 family RNA polymerase sigma factor [Echinicola pacifica]GGZ13317.1 DNA-directed RNA polymerase sigma-70 factor [Echinicola pacifica]
MNISKENSDSVRNLHASHEDRAVQQKAIPVANDELLWARFKAGDEEAYASIYKDNVETLYKYGLKLVQDKSLVKDCIQDLFIEIWESKDRLGSVSSIKFYLFKSFRRKLLKQKTTSSSLFKSVEEAELENACTASDEIKLIEKQRLDEDRQKLKNALSQLTEKQKEIIHLKFYCHLSYNQIGEVMKLDRKATYNLMAHAIKLLRKHLKYIFSLAIALLSLALFEL